MLRYARRQERRRRIRRLFFLLLIMTIAGIFIDLWQESPRRRLVPADDGVYRYAGALHVHSVYSDGGGTVEAIAQAARDAGLDFVVLTEHGTMQPLRDGKQGYHNGVLVLIGEEVNTSAGHMLALGMNRHVEQDGPQGFEALLDTIHAAGGLAISAHPDGRRPWTAWSLDRIHGLEILNADSEWRNDHPWEWLRALLGYAFFPDAALNSLVDRPDTALQRWHTLLQRRHVTGIGSVDAHARIPLWGDRFIRFPSYERMFRLLRTYVTTDRPLTGDAGIDNTMILEALRTGRCYIAVDGYERAVRFSFEWINGKGTAAMGERVVMRPGSHLRVSAGSSGRVLIRLFRDGMPVADTRANEMAYPVTTPGVYRAEVYQLRRRLPLWQETPRPWIFSNPIRVVQNIHPD